VAEKLQPHSQEKQWRGVWPSAVCRGAFYYTIAVKPGLEELIEGLRNCSYRLGYALPSSAENSQILSHRFFRWL